MIFLLTHIGHVIMVGRMISYSCFSKPKISFELQINFPIFLDNVAPFLEHSSSSRRIIRNFQYLLFILERNNMLIVIEDGKPGIIIVVITTTTIGER